jgi:Tfp pilus assembly protein FimT
MKAQVTRKGQGRHSESGKSVVETLAVLAIASILTAVAVPQVLSARRLIRTNSLSREISAQLRFARQQAMSQRQAFTFQYDDTLKKVNIIDHQAAGPTVLSASGYPNTAGSITVLSIPIAGSAGLPTSEVSFGAPSGITATTLGDNTTPTSLSSNKLNITFQPDGTVVDSNGNTTNRTLFFYNNVLPSQTASAISVLGAAGRIKVWRYSTSASQYVE